MFHETTKRFRVTRTLIAGAALLALATVGCAGAGVSRVAQETDRPLTSAVFATIDGAALDALSALRTDTNPATRDRFRVGRILAVPGGYVWEAPAVAKPGPRPVVRLSSGPDHVATYLARDPRVSGNRAALERHHARIERALVERRDARHRPLFVLTEVGRVLAYRGETGQEELPSFAVND